ncbi:RNA methyltransferase At5g10620 [Olea europaea subsp. europaea]|uniref:RNA methyltransferase At5g10620 n=1 Tax=Olea europaea subsp. europaea TaxID=158383 RepID=A0A8S0TTA8_OLEEU|nr:RNA methyltransferase At5g10620 [Olea europaea subsp. europaea]
MAISLNATCKTHYSNSTGKGCKYAGHSVKALPIRILTVGKKRSPGVQLIVDDFIDKLKHYCRVEDVRVKSNPKNARDVIAQIEHEDMAVMDLIRSNEWVVMLDEHGLDVGSEQMASLIGDAGNKGASSLLFCIGGPYGHGRQLRERANLYSVSNFTGHGRFSKERSTITRYFYKKRQSSPTDLKKSFAYLNGSMEKYREKKQELRYLFYKNSMIVY